MENGDTSEEREQQAEQLSAEKKQRETKLSEDRVFFLKYEDATMPPTTASAALKTRWVGSETAFSSLALGAM